MIHILQYGLYLISSIDIRQCHLAFADTKVMLDSSKLYWYLQSSLYIV